MHFLPASLAHRLWLRKSSDESDFAVSRPRGHKEESSLLASLCSPLGALQLVADPHISFEHLVFLVNALAEGEELTLASCEDCGALTVGDRISFKARHCLQCASKGN
jgi:hypothetical protein